MCNSRAAWHCSQYSANYAIEKLVYFESYETRLISSARKRTLVCPRDTEFPVNFMTDCST